MFQRTRSRRPEFQLDRPITIHVPREGEDRIVRLRALISPFESTFPLALVLESNMTRDIQFP